MKSITCLRYHVLHIYCILIYLNSFIEITLWNYFMIFVNYSFFFGWELLITHVKLGQKGS